MTDPPDPGVHALLLALAARLGFRITTRDPNGTELGIFVEGTADRYLVLTSGGIDGTWAILDTLPPDFGPFLLSRATYDVLHSCRLNEDGFVAFEGKSYRVRMAFTGAHWTAKAIPVEALSQAAR